MPKDNLFHPSTDENGGLETRIFTEFNVAMLTLVAAAFAVILFAAAVMSALPHEAAEPSMTTSHE